MNNKLIQIHESSNKLNQRVPLMVETKPINYEYEITTSKTSENKANNLFSKSCRTVGNNNVQIHPIKQDGVQQCLAWTNGNERISFEVV